MKIKHQASDESTTLEIIELAIDDINTLTRAFDMITRVCDELNNPHIELDDSSETRFLN